MNRVIDENTVKSSLWEFADSIQHQKTSPKPGHVCTASFIAHSLLKSVS